MGRLGRMELLAPLRHRPYRLLFAGQVISDVGDWLDILALFVLIVYRWEMGPAALGALLAAMTLPYATVGLVAGVWVDRWPRRTTMIVCDLARAVVVLGLIWAPNFAAVLALTLAKQTFTACFIPARAASIRSTVPPDDLLAASSLSQFSMNGARVLAPALGGVLVALLGPRGVFAVDALTFVVSAAVLSRLPAMAPAPAQPGARRRFWAEFREGVAYIRGRQLLLVTVGGWVIGGFVIRANDSLGPLVLRALRVDEDLIGAVFTSVGLGYVLGAALVGQWGKRVHPLALIGTGQLVAGLLAVAVGVAVVLDAARFGTRVIPFVMLDHFLAGMAFATMSAPFGYIVQRETRPELMGRVSGAVTALSTAVPLAAPLPVAVLAARMGVGPVSAATGAALALLGAAMFLVIPRLHAQDSDAAAPPEPVLVDGAS